LRSQSPNAIKLTAKTKKKNLIDKKHRQISAPKKAAIGNIQALSCRFLRLLILASFPSGISGTHRQSG